MTIKSIRKFCLSVGVEVRKTPQGKEAQERVFRTDCG